MPFETLDILDIKLTTDVMACAESAKTCLKFSIVFLNIPVILIGATSLVAGIWVLEDDSSFVNMAADVIDLKVLGDDVLYQAAVVMITAGSAMIFLAGIGVIGALSHSSCMLGFYTMAMVLLLALQVAALVLGIVFKSEWEGKMNEAMTEKVIGNYGGSLDEDRKKFTALYDELQEKLSCCGWDSPLDEYDHVDRIHWDNINEDGLMMRVPPSCCTSRGNGTQEACTIKPVNSTSFNSQPCSDAIHAKLTEYQWVVVGTAACILVFQFLMIVLTIGAMAQNGDTKYEMS